MMKRYSPGELNAILEEAFRTKVLHEAEEATRSIRLAVGGKLASTWPNPDHFAEDIAQAGWVAIEVALRKNPGEEGAYDPEKHRAAAWVAKLTHNAGISLLRKEHRQDRILDRQRILRQAQETPDAMALADDAEQKRVAVHECVCLLDDVLQQLICLRYFAFEVTPTYEKLSAILGMSQTWVGEALDRAHELLRTMLEKRGI
ncbi:MAG: sigma-70 family RNA polymerase sigma factor [Planctomycetia bacterium]|nr:sigma-70 family RNA polymerase sigma factor [Planctomycetia bacterium]